MKLGSRVKIKNDCFKFFPDSYREAFTGIVMRSIDEAHLCYPIVHPGDLSKISEKSIFSIRWENANIPDTYVLSGNLEFIEEPTTEWLVTHQDDDVRAIGQVRINAEASQ